MNRKIQFIAAFLVLLVLHIPFYVTSVHAAINSVSVRGTSKIEGYAKTKDTLEFSAKVAIPGNSSISPSQVILGSSIQFEKCQATASNESICTLNYGNNSAFEIRPFAYTVNLFRKDGIKDSSYSGNVLIDGLPPDAEIEFFGTDFSTAVPIRVHVNAQDFACLEPSCESRCVGLQKVEFFVVNGSYKKIIDFVNSTSSCSQDVNFSVDVAQLENGPVVFSVTAFDRFGHSSKDQTKSVNVDKIPPVIIANSLSILKDGVVVNGISPRDVPVDVFVNISGGDLDKDSVVADLSSLNPNANYKSLKPNECPQVNSNMHTCKWSIVMNSGTAIPQSNAAEGNQVTANAVGTPVSGSKVIVINASDVRKNKASVTISKNLPLDANGPVIVWLITPYLIENQFYARPSGNTITATFTEESGITASDVKLHADSDIISASRCRKAGNWICTFEDVSLSEGKLSIGQDTTDMLLNPAKNEKAVVAIIDGQAPVVTGISLKSINNLDNPLLFKVSDKISVEANVTEKNQLLAFADFSRFIKNAKNVKGDCIKKEDEKWTCTWITDAIEFQATADISFNFSDPVSNLQIESRQLTTLGLDSAAPPDYWSIINGSIACSPKTLDRQLGPFVNQRLFCSIKLEPRQVGVQTVSISPAKCASNALLQSVETINRQPSSTNPIAKFTFKKDSFNINELELDCSFEIFTRTGDKITKNPEIEPAKITVRFYNQPLGELSEEVENKITAAKKDAQGIWELVGTLNKMVSYAKKICQLINTFYTILAAYYTLTILLHASAPVTFGATAPAATTSCFSTEEMSKIADKMKGGVRGGGPVKGLNKFCDFVTCRQTLWGGDVEKWVNDNLEIDYLSDKRINPTGQGRPISTYLDPQNSLAVATLYGCLPGIIAGLDKYRQIKCLYADCLINSVGKDGMPVKVCEDQKEYATCKYILGEIFSIIPYTAMFDHFMGLIKDTLSNPFKLIGVAVSLHCQGACNVPDAGASYTFCRGARLFALVGDAAQNINNIIDTGFKVREDYCERIDFDDGGNATKT